MEKWIFQDIVDIENETDAKTYNVYLWNLRRNLHEKIQPEIYVRYLLWECDIYVDVALIIYEAKRIYDDLSNKQIFEWIKEYKQPHHVLCP